MDFAFKLAGNAPHLKKYQVNSTFADSGVVARAPGANNAGVVISTTTSFADAIGVCLDTATYVTAQQSDFTAERKITLIIDPDAIYRARICGSAAGAAMAAQTITTATTDGLDVTTAAEWSSPEYDEGAVWGWRGANAGELRKITSTSSTAGTVTVAFNRDHAVGDIFLRAPFWPLGTATFTLTTDLRDVRADAAVATNTAAARVLDLEIFDEAGDPDRTRNRVLFMLNDHILRDAT